MPTPVGIKQQDLVATAIDPDDERIVCHHAASEGRARQTDDDRSPRLKLAVQVLGRALDEESPQPLQTQVIPQESASPVCCRGFTVPTPTQPGSLDSISRT